MRLGDRDKRRAFMNTAINFPLINTEEIHLIAEGLLDYQEELSSMELYLHNKTVLVIWFKCG